MRQTESKIVQCPLLLSRILRISVLNPLCLPDSVFLKYSRYLEMTSSAVSHLCSSEILKLAQFLAFRSKARFLLMEIPTLELHLAFALSSLNSLQKN